MQKLSFFHLLCYFLLNLSKPKSTKDVKQKLRTEENLRQIIIMSYCGLKFIHSEKATKIWNTLSFCFDAGNVEKSRRLAQFAKTDCCSTDNCILTVYPEPKSICTYYYWNVLVKPQQFWIILNHMHQILDAFHKIEVWVN